MPKATPAQRALFNEQFDPLGQIRSDDHTILHHNSSPSLSFFPGEPFPKTAGSGAIVYLAQSLIKPDQTKSVVRYFRAIFPCNFSADVKDGDEVYWDVDNEVVSLAGDVTNGFALGYATFSIEPGKEITAADDDRPVVATSSSTKVEVVNLPGATTLKGSASAFVKDKQPVVLKNPPPLKKDSQPTKDLKSNQVKSQELEKKSGHIV